MFSPINNVNESRIQPVFRRLALNTQQTIVGFVASFMVIACLSLPLQAQEHPTAKELLEQGITQYDQGELENAKATLQRVDVVQLNKQDRQRLVDALKAIRTKQADMKSGAAAAEGAATEEAKPKKKDKSIFDALFGGDDDKEPAKDKPAAEAKGEEAKPAEDAPAEETKPADVADAPKEAMSDADKDSIIALAIDLETQRYIAMAEKAAREGNYNTAEEYYSKALAISPDNDKATKGRETVRAILHRGGGEPSLLDKQEGNYKIQSERAKAQYNQAMREAQDQFKAENFKQALDAISLARAITEDNRNYLSPSDYNQMNNMADNAAARIEAMADRNRLEEMAKQEVVVADIENKRRRAAEQERQRKIQQLLRRSADLRKELAYQQAIEVLDELLFIDPNNIAAAEMKIMMQDAIEARRYRDAYRARSLNIAKHAVDNIEATNPYTELVMYPPDWPQLTVERLAGLTSGSNESEADRVVAEKLRQPIPVQFDGNTFENVVEYLRNVTGINLFVNWKSLEAAGIAPNTTITLQLSNVPADKALRLILDQVGGELVSLGYTIDEGVVTISTRDQINQNTVIRTYDIRDLLVQAPNFEEAPEFDLNQITQSTQGGGGQSGSLFSDSDEEEEGILTRTELTEQIKTLIRETVDPENWRQNGGIVSSMNELNGTLIINSTTDNHKQVLSILNQLREQRALQIAVEGRFLLVDQNYLDEVGVDIDFTWNDPGGKFGPISVDQESSDIAQRQNSTLPGSFSGPQFRDDPNDTDSEFRRSLTLSGSFLDDLEVNFLIRATRADSRSVVLDAPRLTFFNGQRAYVTIARQIAYVSDLDPVVATGSVAFDPEVSVISSGVVLDVEGTISADRRYVTMTVRPSLATVRTPLRTVETSASAGGGGNLILNQNQQNQGSSTAPGQIEVPELELTSVRTTVSVPDKGTLLLGGQRLVGDLELESGVPVLSKIPVLSRLFTNRVTQKDERTLLILIKPTIIVQSEKEDELFPGLNQNPELFGGQ